MFLEQDDISRVNEQQPEENSMHSVIYIIGLVVVVLAILSFLGLA